MSEGDIYDLMAIATDFVNDYCEKEISIEDFYEENIAVRGMDILIREAFEASIWTYGNEKKIRKIARLKLI